MLDLPQRSRVLGGRLARPLRKAKSNLVPLTPTSDISVHSVGYLSVSPWCHVNNPSDGLLAEHDARVHIVRLYLIICAHCVLNASENDTEKTRLYIPITELWYSLKPDNWPPDP